MGKRGLALIASPLGIACVLTIMARQAAAGPSDSTAAPSSCPEGMAFIPGAAPFCLDLTEVTVDAYKSCVDRGACTAPNPQTPAGPDHFCNWRDPGRASHPVNCIDWGQASSYCGSLGKSLPSDPEWRWAAHNGPEATPYPWGSAAPNPSLLNACGDECWPSLAKKLGSDLRLLEGIGEGPLYHGDDGFETTAPVGSFPKGDDRWGVHDLAGNVIEWTSTVRGTRDGVRTFVVAGGSYHNGALGRRLGLSSEGQADENSRGFNLGFRCAR